MTMTSDASPAPVLGQSVDDKLALGKVTGSGRFIGDVEEAGALHVAVLRSDLSHGLVETLDLGPALASRGVVAAVGRGEMGLAPTVRQYGDLLAAVAAETPLLARAAIRQLQPVIRELPPIFDPREAAVAGDLDGSSYDDPKGDATVRGNTVFEQTGDFGDVDTAFAEADLVVEGTYRTGRPVHCNLSRHACFARLLPDGRIEVVTSVDGPFYARRELAKQLKMPEERIIVVLPDLLSSSFGAHSTINPLLEPVAVALALKTQGRPVRFEFDPEEEFYSSHTRHPVEVRIRSGARADGLLLALDVDVVADHGAFPNYISRVVISNFRDRVGELVRVQNYRFRGRAISTNNPNAGEFRGIGSTQLMFCLGAHLDEVASRLGVDPVEFYAINAVEPGESAVTTGKLIRSSGLKECLREGAKAIEWHDRPHSEDLGDGRRRGIGVGIGTHTTGLGHEGGDSSIARLSLLVDGRIELAIGAPDSGQGGATVYSQIAAQELGVPYELVEVAASDTRTSPKDFWGTVAARGAFMVGAAVGDAAIKLKQLITERAETSLQLKDAVLESGKLLASDGRSMSLAEVASRIGPVSVEGHSSSSDNPPTYGAYFAQVVADLETGEVKVERVVAALDVGYALNPLNCRGQIEGAVMMGIELALLGNLEVEDGIPVNGSFLAYHLATMHDLPEIKAILVEATEPAGPYGVKGIGTPAMTPAAPAICNALSAALQRRVATIPARPEAVLSLLGNSDG
jgi:CO/xanthine dehydrogenase Mo-binding subunit